ncbi:MAG TPA: Gfo/Idh/MocA family oxidoreductase [Vicinamibacterales bacterium]|nr:Gfo/Idh/MocA family oxidoreductase [Vicinamibacterales bacterium]
MPVDRRDFIRTAGAATAATALSYTRILGANDRVRLGLIGCGSRGVGDMNNFLKLEGVEAVALCDVYSAQVDVARKSAPAAKTCRHHRELLEMKDVDAVIIAVPDHWHTPMTIEALNAGKDVYVEKPLTLRVEEGPDIVKAARVNNRICQVGMQQRSGAHYIQAKQEFFDSGKLGKITLVRTWWHGNTFHLRRAPESLRTKPADLDWGRFLGPVSWRDYDPQQYYNWRAYLDFGGGQITDLFTHWIDVVHMFMGQDIPIAAAASGGVYNYKDGRTAPDTIHVLLEYPKEFTATFEATLVPSITGAAIEFCGTEGRLVISRARYEVFQPNNGTPIASVQATGHMDRDHMQNFLECMRSRRLPNGDVLIGHRSAQASHLGNIAYLEKRRIAFDPVREVVLPS